MAKRCQVMLPWSQIFFWPSEVTTPMWTVRGHYSYLDSQRLPLLFEQSEVTTPISTVGVSTHIWRQWDRMITLLFLFINSIEILWFTAASYSVCLLYYRRLTVLFTFISSIEILCAITTSTVMVCTAYCTCLLLSSLEGRLNGKKGCD